MDCPVQAAARPGVASDTACACAMPATTFHSFELTKLAAIPGSGVMKDVVMLGGYQEVEVDFTADNHGLTLSHCHQQLHMDFGFMTLFEYT